MQAVLSSNGVCETSYHESLKRSGYESIRSRCRRIGSCGGLVLFNCRTCNSTLALDEEDDPWKEVSR